MTPDPQHQSAQPLSRDAQITHSVTLNLPAGDHIIGIDTPTTRYRIGMI